MSVVLAAGGSKALWFATRGAGTVTFVLLTATVVLGIAGAARLQSMRLPRFVVAGLHRNVTLLALALLTVHIGTSVLDTYAPIGVKDVFIPFVSSYRPLWLGLGAVAFDLLLALTITSFLRTRIGFRRWKQLHWLAYAAWPVALVHALGTGSDARVGWLQLVAAICTLSVVASVLVRLGAPSAWSTERAFAGGAALVLPLVVGVWYATGPGKTGWAARAGTPATLLASRRQVAARPPLARVHTTSTSVPTLPQTPFTASFRGRLHQTVNGGQALIDITGTTSGAAAGRLWIRLQGIPSGEGVSMTASGASFGPRGWPDEYVGSIVSLEGTQLELSLAGNNHRMLVGLDLSIDQATNTVSGTVHAAAGAGESQ